MHGLRAKSRLYIDLLYCRAPEKRNKDEDLHRYIQIYSGHQVRNYAGHGINEIEESERKRSKVARRWLWYRTGGGKIGCPS